MLAQFPGHPWQDDGLACRLHKTGSAACATSFTSTSLIPPSLHHPQITTPIAPTTAHRLPDETARFAVAFRYRTVCSQPVALVATDQDVFGAVRPLHPQWTGLRADGGRPKRGHSQASTGRLFSLEIQEPRINQGSSI
jgi:hypothetical protein